MLRDGSGQNLRDYLITTAARLIDQRGGAGLAVRDIAREAKVADGVLYNYFEDKEDLLAHALAAHVGTVMHAAPRILPPPGEGTVAENLRLFIDRGIAVLVRVTPAFASLLAQPKVLSRFHAMVGGDAAFGAAVEPSADDEAGAAGGIAGGGRAAAAGAGDAAGRGGHGGSPRAAGGERGLPELLTGYLRAEQRLGRIDPAADIDAAASLIVGAIHGQILPRVLFNPPGSPITTQPGFAARIADTVLSGIAPRSRRT